MVVAGKIFKLNLYMNMSELRNLLSSFEVEKEIELGEKPLTLEYRVADIENFREGIKFNLLQDRVKVIPFKEGERTVTLTYKVPMLAYPRNRQIYLLICRKKYAANAIASIMARKLFGDLNVISGIEIPHETLVSFHEANREDTKVIFFDGIGPSNLKKISLYGSMLADTDIFRLYAEKGRIWYMVVRSRRYGYVMGITRDASVTVFNNIPYTSFFNFVIDEILPLLP